MNETTSAADGLLLFAHGARDPLWARPFEAVAQHCRDARGETAAERSSVVLGFLEFMAPDLLGAGQALVSRGCRRVVVVPLFLGAGGHVRKDLPLLLTQLRCAHPGVDFALQPSVGESPLLVAAMAQVALQSAQPAPAAAVGDARPGPAA
jgi:sirohydrochlorin cobaltochelatase